MIWYDAAQDYSLRRATQLQIARDRFLSDCADHPASVFPAPILPDSPGYVSKFDNDIIKCYHAIYSTSAWAGSGDGAAWAGDLLTTADDWRPFDEWMVTQ